MTTIDRTLRQARGRLRRERALKGGQRGLVLGLGLAALSVVALRLSPSLINDAVLAAQIAAIPLWAAVATPVAGLMLVGILLAWRYRWTPFQLARLCDQRLGLHARLATAVELRGRAERNLLAERQIADAEAMAGRVDLRAAIPVRLSTWQAALPTLLAALVVGAFFLPNPFAGAAKQRALVRQVVETEAARVTEIKQAIAQAPGLKNDAKRQELEKTLTDLEQTLAQAANEADKEKALGALSTAAGKLEKLIDRSLPLQKSTLANLGRRLQDVSATKQLAQDLQNRNFDAAAQDLRVLANNLDKLTPEERNAVSQQLQNAARQLSATSSPVTEPLRQAAQALQQGQNGNNDARQSLNRAADALGQIEQQTLTEDQVRRAQAQVDESRDGVNQGLQQQSGEDTNSANTLGAHGTNAQGNNPDRPGQTSNRGQGAGQNNNAGQQVAGTRSPNPGQGVSNGNGQPLTDQQGQTGTGDYNEQVYTPSLEELDSKGNPGFVQGQENSAGNSDNLKAGKGPGQATAAQRPYVEVLHQYRDNATNALENAPIPLTMKDYVRNYFGSLDPDQ